jgi:hypothetical protein
MYEEIFVNAQNSYVQPLKSGMMKCLTNPYCYQLVLMPIFMMPFISCAPDILTSTLSEKSAFESSVSCSLRILICVLVQ